MKKFLLIPLTFILIQPVIAQDEDDDWDDEETVKKTTFFYDTRGINAHTVSVLDKGTLDFRITHRFGEIATPASPRSLFGLDNSSDIRIAFEYGLIENLNIGAGRSKGSFHSEVWDGFLKYKILQKEGSVPLALTAMTSAYFTSRKESEDPTAVNAFTETAHRFWYASSLIFAIKPHKRLTLQVAPTYVHRNFVGYYDANSMISMGGILKYNFYKKASFVAEYFYNLDNERSVNPGEYVNPFALGAEIKTFAHTFQMHFMNSGGIGEGQFIPYTTSRWTDGAFRFGFTISRHF